MAPLIERIGCMAFARDLFRGLVPGVACLAAAMQQQYGRAAVAEHVGNELVAGGADEGRGGGSRVPGHGRSLRKFKTASAARSGYEPSGEETVLAAVTPAGHLIVLRAFTHFPSDYELLNLGRALVNSEHAHISVKAFDVIPRSCSRRRHESTLRGRRRGRPFPSRTSCSTKLQG